MAEIQVRKLLGINEVSLASNSKRRQHARAGMLLLDILQRHAPDVVAMRPDAKWDQAMQAAVRQDILASFSRRASRHRALNAIARVINAGRSAGIWAHEGWAQLSERESRPGRLSQADGELITATSMRMGQFVEVLPAILRCPEPDVVAGAILVAAADYSAVLAPELLAQTIDGERSLFRHDDLVWMTLRLGDPEAPRRNVRRWFPDPISLLLVAHHRSLAPGTLDPNRALLALHHWCQWPGMPIALNTLIRTARARWCTQLPGFQLSYALDPLACPSIPEASWIRLLTDRKLDRGESPENSRAKAMAVARARIVPGIQSALDLAGPGNRTEQREALGALLAVLGRAEDQPLHTREELIGLLKIWWSSHHHVGGWVVLMAAWVEKELIANKPNKSPNDGSPVVSTILRYLSGFGRRWLSAFGDVPPCEIDPFGSDTANRMERLEQSLLGLATSQPARTGLTSFLAFVESSGGPPLRLNTDNRLAHDAPAADANFISPAEFDRVLAYIGRAHGYRRNGLRLRAMTILAYWLGLRWEDVRALQWRDIRLGKHDTWLGVIRIRRNAYKRGKTVDSIRRLPLEAFVPQGDLKKLFQYLEMARGRDDDFVFADARTQNKPPLRADTNALIQAAMREVTGDHALVFHHLRHSAANSTLVRMQPEGERSFYRSWLPGADRLSSSALGWPQSQWLAGLAGRPDNDASRSYVVSELLGQMDPSTAMGSYLHLMDVVMSRTISALVSLPPTTLARIDGVKLESIHRRNSRHRGGR